MTGVKNAVVEREAEDGASTGVENLHFPIQFRNKSPLGNFIKDMENSCFYLPDQGT